MRMSRDLLIELLDRNDEHVASAAAADLDAQRDGQQPPVVSVCCSDSRVPRKACGRSIARGTSLPPATSGTA